MRVVSVQCIGELSRNNVKFTRRDGHYYLVLINAKYALWLALEQRELFLQLIG